MPKTVIQVKKTESKYPIKNNDYKQQNETRTIIQVKRAEPKYPIRNSDYKQQYAPKTVIQTKKTESKYPIQNNDYKQEKIIKTIYQAKKTETKYPIRNSDYKQQISNNTNYNSSKDYNTNTSSNVRDKPKIMYFARCPHCNFFLNDENEVKKYYCQTNYNTASNFYKNSNQNYITIETNGMNKYNHINNSNKDLNKNQFFSPKVNERTQNYLFKSNTQNNFIKTINNMTTPKTNGKYYQIYGTTAKK